jgi:hypothetical protein
MVCSLNMSQSLNMVHFHFTLNLRAINYKIGLLFPTVLASDEFQRPLELHGHGFWSMCKLALSMKVQSGSYQIYTGYYSES